MDYQRGYGLEHNYSGIRRKSHKTFWTIFFVVLFVGILVGIYFMFVGNEEVISEKKLSEGSTFELGQNSTVKLKVGNDDHGIKIDFIGLDSVDLTISSDPIKIKGLKRNEVREVDLNSDGILDLRVKLVKIENGKATIAVKKIEKECSENWSCSSWSFCSVLGRQTRECSDLNNCGTIDARPELEKECVEVEIIENGSAFENNVSKTINQTSENTTEIKYNFSGNKTLFLENDSVKKAYLNYVKNLCNQAPPYCGEINSEDELRRIEHIIEGGYGGKSSLFVWDEHCSAVCFGKALQTCTEAEITVYRESGSFNTFRTIKNGSSCNVELSYDNVVPEDFDSHLNSTSIVCPLNKEDLSDYSCLLGNCLEKDMPGMTFAGEVILLSFSLASLDDSCYGTAINAQEDYLNSFGNSCEENSINLGVGENFSSGNISLDFIQVNQNGTIWLEVNGENYSDLVVGGSVAGYSSGKSVSIHINSFFSENTTLSLDYIVCT